MLLIIGAITGAFFITSGASVGLAGSSEFNINFALSADLSTFWIVIALASLSASGAFLNLMHKQTARLHILAALAILGVLAANVITLIFVLVAMDLLAARFTKQETQASLPLRWIGVIVLAGSELNLGFSSAPWIAFVGLSIRQAGVWSSQDKSEAMLSTTIHLMALGRMSSEAGLALAALAALAGSAGYAFRESGAGRLGMALAGLGAIPLLAGATDTALLAASLTIAAIPNLLASRLFVQHQRIYRYLFAGLVGLSLQHGYGRMLPDYLALYVLAIFAAGATIYGVYSQSQEQAGGWPLPETARKFAYEAGFTLPLLVGGLTFIATGFDTMGVNGVVWLAGAAASAVGFYFASNRLPPLVIRFPWEQADIPIRSMLSLLRNLGSILEGRGAFLWMVLLILLALLVTQ